MDFEFNNGPFDHGAADLYASCEVAGDGALAMALKTDLALLSVAGDGAVVSNPIELVLAPTPVTGYGLVASTVAFTPKTISVYSMGPDIAVAWGSDYRGQCTIPDELVAIQIAAGGYHSLALKAEGSVVAWGYNNYGQCDVPDGLVATQISAGGWHCLALKADGSVVAWGYNYYGQCTVPAGLVAAQISAGDRHSLALKADGSVVAWGYNGQGQCNVPAGLVAIQIFAGKSHNLAIETGGSVVAWGDNFRGQCDVPDGLVATQVTVGDSFSMALKANGSVVAWGYNVYGQCDVPAGLVATQIYGGGYHSLAIGAGGLIVAWGSNDDGQCDVPDEFVATQISAGILHSFGLGSTWLHPCGEATPMPIEFCLAVVATLGDGLAYAAPAHVEFDPDAYQFETITVTRSAQDALWSCQGRIDGLTVPRAYMNFTISAQDHNAVSRKIFFGFVPGRDYVIQVAANKSMIQGYDAGFYLTRQFLPDGNLSYPHALGWSPMGLIKYWLGEETLAAGSPSEWEIISGIKPYRIHNPTSYGHDYTAKDFVFQPTSTKVSAIQEVCEYSHMVFLVKWNMINDIIVPCAYLIHEEDIDDVAHGLDLPTMVDITHPDNYVLDSIRVTEKSDERYNRIIVRSSTPAGGWLQYVKQTQALDMGDEFPVEYLEERSDLHTIGLVENRVDELYNYYTEYTYNYTLTLINRTDLELYQRCRFYSYGYIPEGTVMRIVAIQYVVKATHTEVQITVTPDSRLSDLKRLEKSQNADAVSTIQTVAKDQIEAEIVGTEVATVATVDDGTGTVELERGDTIEVRYVEGE